MTTEVQATPIGVWFYGIGTCDSCDTHHHLYASNVVRGCALCPEHLLGATHSVITNHYEFSETWERYHEVERALYDYRTVVPEIQPDAHTYCGTCLRPFQEGERKVSGRHFSGTPAFFHADCCTQDCSVCETYVPRWSWAQPLSANNRSYYDYLRDTSQSGGYTNPLLFEGERYCNEHLQAQLEEVSSYFQCERCSEYFDGDRSTYFYWRGDHYCDECRDEYFGTCDYCDEWYDREDDHNCEHDEEQDESGIIHSYGYKPYYQYYGTGSYYLGFELEIQRKDSDNTLNYGAEKLLNIIGNRAYYKYDGSVDDGFEIVTHPHTLEEYQTKFPWGFVPVAKSLGYRSWNAEASCGFHVHVGRVAFGPGKNPHESDKLYLERTIIVRQRHEIRFTKLFYDNQRQVERIAGRQANMYAQFGDKGNIYNKVKRGWSNDGRYSVINTENRDTIEVRIFKGSLNQARILANIELVHCAVEYTRDLKVTGSNKALSWVKFAGYVGQNMEKYPHLFALMEKTFSNEPLYDNRTEESEGAEF